MKKKDKAWNNCITRYGIEITDKEHPLFGVHGVSSFEQYGDRPLVPTAVIYYGFFHGKRGLRCHCAEVDKSDKKGTLKFSISNDDDECDINEESLNTTKWKEVIIKPKKK